MLAPKHAGSHLLPTCAAFPGVEAVLAPKHADSHLLPACVVFPDVNLLLTAVLQGRLCLVTN